MKRGIQRRLSSYSIDIYWEIYSTNHEMGLRRRLPCNLTTNDNPIYPWSDQDKTVSNGVPVRRCLETLYCSCLYTSSDLRRGSQKVPGTGRILRELSLSWMIDNALET